MEKSIIFELNISKESQESKLENAIYLPKS